MSLSEIELAAYLAETDLYRRLTLQAEKEICAVPECEGPLLVRWWQGRYELVCGKDNSHQGTKSKWDNKSIKERDAREMAMQTSKGTEIVQYSGRVSLTQPEATQILETLWPESPKVEILKAALLCRQYGLNPLMRHIYLVGYKNKDTGEKDWSIQIGIGATRMIARRAGSYSYEDNTPRLMTEAEQTAIMGEVDKTKFWAITKLRDSHGASAQGYGSWNKSDGVKGANKGNTPQNMAFIRSERAALDKLLPEKLPVGFETVASEYEESPRIINQETGEITEGTPPEQPSVSVPPPSSAKPIFHGEGTSAPASGPQSKPLVDVNTRLPNLNPDWVKAVDAHLTKLKFPAGEKRDRMLEKKFPGAKVIAQLTLKEAEAILASPIPQSQAPLETPPDEFNEI